MTFLLWWCRNHECRSCSLSLCGPFGHAATPYATARILNGMKNFSGWVLILTQCFFVLMLVFSCSPSHPASTVSGAMRIGQHPVLGVGASAHTARVCRRCATVGRAQLNAERRIAQQCLMPRTSVDPLAEPEGEEEAEGFSFHAAGRLGSLLQAHLAFPYAHPGFSSWAPSFSLCEPGFSLYGPMPFPPFLTEWVSFLFSVAALSWLCSADEAPPSEQVRE